ncbi:MAG: hypothetical protein IJJ26_05830, partial [Victivallales bacterium]|nr:hypothetical protein [Victivallales bacterium]
VHFGWKEGAGNGYDSGVDVLIPPFAMGSGMVGFLQTGDRKEMLYTDLRAPELPQEWKISADPLRTRRPVQFSWDPASLPKDVSFTIRVGNKDVDMSQSSTVSLPEKGVLVIRATKKEPQP